ncbi:MAG TPA: CPBP family intramembrane glutamic endopeptidase, partial [Anaerolineales bacterium]|nr:CPBP family intramembrane glutamic endopeptidase [Anaerolineales bacterium]
GNGREMNSELQKTVPTPDAPDHSVPWKFMDNWIGVALLAVINIVIFIIVLQGRRTDIAQSAGIVLLELAYLLPVILIFAWRRVHWKSLRFGRFDWNTLGIGCGLLITSYVIILLHNLLLFALGVDTQGEAIMKIFAELDAPVWFFIVGAVFAPLVEEIFFRGFLFQGFRQKYGWVTAMLISSAIFAVAHLDPVVLIPTFILGCLLAYMYHRSNSVWPGIILHFLVNSFGLCGAYFAANYQNLIPV